MAPEQPKKKNIYLEIKIYQNAHEVNMPEEICYTGGRVILIFFFFPHQNRESCIKVGSEDLINRKNGETVTGISKSEMSRKNNRYI